MFHVCILKFLLLHTQTQLSFWFIAKTSTFVKKVLFLYVKFTFVAKNGHETKYNFNTIGAKNNYLLVPVATRGRLVVSMATSRGSTGSPGRPNGASKVRNVFSVAAAFEQVLSAAFGLQQSFAKFCNFFGTISCVLAREFWIKKKRALAVEKRFC